MYLFVQTNSELASENKSNDYYFPKKCFSHEFNLWIKYRNLYAQVQYGQAINDIIGTKITIIISYKVSHLSAKNKHLKMVKGYLVEMLSRITFTIAKYKNNSLNESWQLKKYQTSFSDYDWKLYLFMMDIFFFLLLSVLKY